MRRRGGAAIAAGMLLSATATADAVEIKGAVGAPKTYAAGELAAIPGTSVKAEGRRFAGASVLALVEAAQPRLPADKRNGDLQVIVTGKGAKGATLSLALGQLLPEYGNRPAVVTKTGTLATRGRVLRGLKTLSVQVVNPTAAPAPSPGGIVVDTGKRQVSLTKQRLVRLPLTTYSTPFSSGDGELGRKRERGPSLQGVLKLAGLMPRRVAYVAAVAGDVYVAAVTPAEQFFGTHQLALSYVEDGTPLEQPRLVVDGDVKASRWVNDVTRLVVACIPGQQCERTSS